MKFKFSYPAGENEIFAKDAFKNSIGKPFKLNIEDGGGTAASQDSSKESTLVDAKVSEDGKTVEFTVDAPGLRIDMPTKRYSSVEIEKER